MLSGHLEPEDTIVSFAPLLDADLPGEQLAAIVGDLRSVCFHSEAAGHYLVPTYSMGSASFDRRRYWRGPVWINTNWLLWQGLLQHGHLSEADEIARSSLALVARAGFREYFDPVDGEGHGSRDFAWTAALAIDVIERLGGPGQVGSDSLGVPHR
jgi:glycogen debranching enzyme